MERNVPYILMFLHPVVWSNIIIDYVFHVQSVKERLTPVLFVACYFCFYEWCVAVKNALCTSILVVYLTNTIVPLQLSLFNLLLVLLFYLLSVFSSLGTRVFHFGIMPKSYYPCCLSSSLGPKSSTNRFDSTTCIMYFFYRMLTYRRKSPSLPFVSRCYFLC